MPDHGNVKPWLQKGLRSRLSKVCYRHAVANTLTNSRSRGSGNGGSNLSAAFPIFRVPLRVAEKGSMYEDCDQSDRAQQQRKTYDRRDDEPNAVFAIRVFSHFLALQVVISAARG